MGVPTDPTDHTDDGSFRLRGTYLRSCALLLLAEGRKHGYELLVEFSARGYGDSDAGGLYRALRAMEDEGLVESSWQQGDFGPARRVYSITDRGAASLQDYAAVVGTMRRCLGRFLRDYRQMTEETAHGAF